MENSETVTLRDETLQKDDFRANSTFSSFQRNFTKIILPCGVFLMILGLSLFAFVMAFVILFSDPFSKSQFNYIIIGDWGTGTQSQLNVAKSISNLANKSQYDFIVSTGDQFYWYGIDNTTDPLIQKYYLDVYNSHDILTDMPWYLSLGNHDYIKNPIAQIEYSKMNRNWILPAKRYTKEFFLRGHINVQFIFMDTSPYSELERSRTPKLRDENPQEQTAWLRNVLENGKYRYKWRFVVGHHPFYSSGTYGDFGHKNMTEIETLLNQYKIDAYFNGHQHILQHLQTLVDGHEMNYFISGAGGQTVSNHIVNQNHTNNKFVLGKMPGFMTQQLLPDKATTKIHDQNGNVVYEFTINKP